MGNITKRLGFSLSNGSMLGSNGTAGLLAKELPAAELLILPFCSCLRSWFLPTSSPIDSLGTLPILTGVKILRGLWNSQNI